MSVDLYSGLAGTINAPRPHIKPQAKKPVKKTPKGG